MFEITDEFSAQVAALHHVRSDNVPVIAGCVLEGPQTPRLASALSALPVQRICQPVWRQGDNETAGSVDFAPVQPVGDWLNDPAAATVRVAGPLLQFDNTRLPDWLPSEATFEEKMNTVKRFCRAFGAAFPRRIKILHVTSGISGVGHQYFNYPQQLQMTLEMLEAAEQVLPNTSMMVSFDQPWGERLSMATGGVPAMEVADALLRYGARISAFGLEFNLGYWPQGSLRRDPLQWVDLVDRWSQFGLPLAIYLSAPSGPLPDSGNGGRFLKTIRVSTEAAAHEDYLRTIVNLLARRPAVNVIAWRRSRDSDNPRFPLSGLADESGHAKPILGNYAKLVEQVLNGKSSPDDTLRA
jgi:hypothetical protein